MKITIPFGEYKPFDCPDYISEKEHAEEILGDLIGIFQDKFNFEIKGNFYFDLSLYQNNKLKQWEITRI
jgi:hypothetical protein